MAALIEFFMTISLYKAFFEYLFVFLPPYPGGSKVGGKEGRYRRY
jgi:hypothetical protein